MQSRYELATRSVYNLKDERIDNAIAYTKQMEKDFPSSDYSNTAIDLRKKLEKEKQNFAVVKKDTEARIKVLTEKQKREEEKLNARNKTEQQLKDQANVERQSQQIRRDSAKLQTPPPAATFKIQR